MADQVLEILRDARELVRKDWGTCNLDVAPGGEGNGGVCASVGIGLAAVPCDLHHPATIAAHVAVLSAAGLPVPDDADAVLAAVYQFNDAQTTIGPVLAAFDRAIATLEVGPTPNADAALEVMGACDRAGEVLARHIVSEHPEMDMGETASMASAELFYAAQDTAQACSIGVKMVRS